MSGYHLIHIPVGLCPIIFRIMGHLPDYRNRHFRIWHPNQHDPGCYSSHAAYPGLNFYELSRKLADLCDLRTSPPYLKTLHQAVVVAGTVYCHLIFEFRFIAAVLEL
jgi:hypothetical protein